ncbi:hypothetical protein [Pelagibius sp.]|uniref:EF-hand domain-containing protein n=1 Tax=Pelagibius sp. TaxID=1931238 RepID=UPI003BAFBA9A
MKRKTILTLSALVVAGVVGAATLPAIAGGWGPRDGWGPWQMMQQMRGPQACFAQDHRRGPLGHGAATLGAGNDNPLYRSFDTDENGTVSAAELEAGIAELHIKHDANGDGTLSRDEFVTLYAEATRSFAECPFAMLDANDDGQLSVEEMAFPAQMMARMQRWHAVADAERH